jgi:molybdate transport system substrate-binding protein
VYFKELLDRLGIAEAMRGKLKPMPAATIAKAVPSGEAEMIVVTMSVIVGSGAELVGPVPAELQFYNRFAGGVGAAAKDRDAAAALLRYLTAPAAAPVIRAKGMEPGVPR